MNQQPSLTGRAFLAVGLMAGFYVLAIGMAAGLLWIPYALFVYDQRVNLRLTAACLFGGLAIIWSIIPRWDKFVPPGPRLDPSRHPRLFEQLRSMASATGQEMPGDVYLIGDVNAWVSARGGLMGFGSRRVMGLGLPLLRVLKVSELRAVVAHEFGHYHGGDTQLGPWIYKTRSAIGRTLANLGAGSWLQKPFLWYGNMFLRITHAISRRQEYAADALAARVAGARSLIPALRKIHGAAIAYDSYWSSEVVPLLQAGYHAPMADGFARFLSAGPIAVSVAQQIEKELKEGKGDPYDTHPPLRERVAALEQLGGAAPNPDEPAAITLVEDLSALERSLLAALAGGDLASGLKNLEWNDAGALVYLPLWMAETRRHAAVLTSVQTAELPSLAKNLDPVRKHFQKIANRSLSDEELARGAGGAIGCALAVTLAQAGCPLICEVGRPIVFARNGAEIEPFRVFADMRAGKLTLEAWRQQCAAAGIDALSLGTAAAEPHQTAR